MNRREFLARASLAASGFGILSCSAPGRAGTTPDAAAPARPPAENAPAQPFHLSLAEWSLHKMLFAGKLTNLDFPRFARAELGFDTIELVDQFFADKSRDTAYLTELKSRCDGEGVRAGLIMVDTAGKLGTADAAARGQAVDNHKAWLDAAKLLGCHALRINAAGDDGAAPDDLRGRIVESCRKLAERGKELDINVVIENHGGSSSDPEWLARVMREVSSPWFGTLPDFGNFAGTTDRYAAVEMLMPFARAVSAKTHEFDAGGKELTTDYPRMMQIVLDAGYRGFVGIECEGAKTADEEPRHIRFARAILEAIRGAQPVLQPIFNGRDTTGWVAVAGGDWSVENGNLVARNGKDWSTDPARTGSWLRTEKEYGDFELFLEYTCARPRSNSGIFIRSGLERNPAFNGYEVQIYDDPTGAPRKSGPGAIYDVVAPAKNRARKAGEWSSVRVIARGPKLRVVFNGELVVDAVGDRNLKGHIGLQNHDDRSEVWFRNIRLAAL